MRSFFRKQKKHSKDTLRHILGDYELPSFSDAVINVLTVLRNPDSSMEEVTEYLQVDPGMHVRVLQTANSAAFGLMTRISNLHHAIVLLGKSRLETILLSHAVRDTLQTVHMPSFNSKRFWHTAVRRAMLACHIALYFNPSSNVESFTAGLLQDMAIPVLISVNLGKYNDILEDWINNKDSWLHILEQEAFGYNHATVGGLIAEQWNLPEDLVKAISGHHDPYEENETLDPAIRLTSYIRENPEDDGTDIITSVGKENFGIEQDKMSEMINKAFEDADEFSKMF